VARTWWLAHQIETERARYSRAWTDFVSFIARACFSIGFNRVDVFLQHSYIFVLTVFYSLMIMVLA
jgi:hypothetical protein